RRSLLSIHRTAVRTMSRWRKATEMSNHKQIVQQYYARIWNNSELTLIDTFMAPDYVNRDPATPAPNGELRGRDAMKQLVQTYKTAFPDLTFTIEGQVEEGDKVVTTWNACGTFLGELNGLEPNGRRGCPRGITVSQFRNGEIVLDDVIWDFAGLLRIIG